MPRLARLVQVHIHIHIHIVHGAISHIAVRIVVPVIAKLSLFRLDVRIVFRRRKPRVHVALIQRDDIAQAFVQVAGGPERGVCVRRGRREGRRAGSGSNRSEQGR
jgi:hypothetical protein